MYAHQDVDTRATTTGALTATGAETVHDTTAVIQYCLDGKAKSKAAITDGATPTTDVVTGSAITLTAGKGTVVVWCLDTSGAVKAIKGTTQNWDGTAWDSYPQFPTIDLETYCPFAYQILKGGSTLSGTWTFGVSNWNATGLSSAITNVQTLPSRPKGS